MVSNVKIRAQIFKAVGAAVIASPVLFIAYYKFAVYAHMRPITVFCNSVPESAPKDEFIALAKHAGFNVVLLENGKVLVPNNGPPIFRNGCEATFELDRLVSREEVDADLHLYAKRPFTGDGFGSVLRLRTCLQNGLFGACERRPASSRTSKSLN